MPIGCQILCGSSQLNGDEISALVCHAHVLKDAAGSLLARPLPLHLTHEHLFARVSVLRSYGSTLSDDLHARRRPRAARPG